MYEYVRNDTTGQLVRAPHVWPVATFKRSGGPNLTSIALSNGRVVRREDSAERGTVVRGVPTRSDHHRGHRRLVPKLGGLIGGPSVTVSVFKASADVPADWYNAHINV